MSIPMFLRSLNMPNWMDEELNMLALNTKIKKAELMRRMIAHGLNDGWAHLDGRTNPPPIYSQYGEELKTRTSVSDRAKRVFANMVGLLRT